MAGTDTVSHTTGITITATATTASTEVSIITATMATVMAMVADTAITDTAITDMATTGTATATVTEGMVITIEAMTPARLRRVEQSLDLGRGAALDQVEFEQRHSGLRFALGPGRRAGPGDEGVSDVRPLTLRLSGRLLTEARRRPWPARAA
jgi:hypothetical protein